MRTVQPLTAFEQIKILAEPHRRNVLQRLMATPATLSQLGQALGESPAWVRHHVKVLEAAGLVEIAEIQTHGIVIEKYYRARAGAYMLQQLVLPLSKVPVLIFAGSHDLVIEALADRLVKHMTLLSLPVGSLDGLVNLRQGLCQICGTHILDKNGEYNLPYVRRFFPDRNVEIVTLANRVQGLILSRGNPHSIRAITDLARPAIRFVNRNSGSGTRLWLDEQLINERISPKGITGYGHVVRTHSEAASLIANGQADVALGLQAAAYQAGLDFIPLYEERYDLVLPLEAEQSFTPLLDYLQTVDFRNILSSLTGYSASHSGELIPL